MRSDIVYRANIKIQDRYQLCRTCSIATRQLHISSTRLQDTINVVLEMIGQGEKRVGTPHNATQDEIRQKSETAMSRISA